MLASISKKLFEKVQDKIETNKQRKSHKKNLDDVAFLLSGKAYDGNCGGALTGDSGTSKNGETYYYYTCTNKKRKKPVVLSDECVELSSGQHRLAQCKTKSVRKEWLEDIIVGATRKIVFDEKLVESIGRWIVQLQEKNVDNTMLKVAEKELQNTKAGIKNIMNAIEKGIVTDTTKDRLLELEARQTQLESEIRLETYRIKAPKVTKEQVIYWLEQFKDGDPKTEIYKKQIIDAFINTIILYDDIVTIAYNYAKDDIVDIPLDNLKDSPDSVRMCLINWRIGGSKI